MTKRRNPLWITFLIFMAIPIPRFVRRQVSQYSQVNPYAALSHPGPFALGGGGHGLGCFEFCRLRDSGLDLPARSLMADTSLARSLVTMVADSFALETPT
jgi:hypothetical protein